MRRRDAPDSILLFGARCATGPHWSEECFLQLYRGRIRRISRQDEQVAEASSGSAVVDLSGMLILPGLINAHDHLQYSLFPRLAAGPYHNYIGWGVDIHARFREVIALHRAVAEEVRVWWGGVRNLLCGVTTVSHHNPMHPEMLNPGFPIRVIHEYGWAHSLALGGDLRQARALTPKGAAFLVHAGEGIDDIARNEVWALDQQGLLDESTVLVHGLALDREGVARLIQRGTSLIVCPSSNQSLFGVLPDLSLLGAIPQLSLGNDSPLTAEGDLLDEVHFAVRSCGITPEAAWTMVTKAPAAVLRLRQGEGALQLGGVGDLVVVKDTGIQPMDALLALTKRDVQLVVVGGRVQLASPAMLERLPLDMRHGLEPLSVDGMVRWLRAPVSYLLRQAEQVLGLGEVRLGGSPVSAPIQVGAHHVL